MHDVRRDFRRLTPDVLQSTQLQLILQSRVVSVGPPPALTFRYVYIFPTECIYEFCVILKINIDHFPECH
jgi:hypothetical protein